MTNRVGERLFAGLLGGLGGIFVGWAAWGATASVFGAVGCGLLGAAIIYAALTHRSRRRARVLRAPYPDWWAEALDDLLPYFRLLDAERKERFLKRTQVFLSEQRVTGVRCEPTEEDALLVAATAVMMTEGFPDFHYPATRELLIYPGAFDPDDFAIHSDGEFIGQVLDAGPVIFSLPDLRRSFTDEDWTNVVVHELTHVLDALWAGEAGGFGTDDEVLVGRQLADRALWEQIAAGESPIDDYAFENEQEFFAVTSEVFFEDPTLLKAIHPEIYDWLAQVYQQDLVALIEKAGAEPADG